MGKHVCPICEDVYAYRGEFRLSTPVRADSFEAWYCPDCGYSFMGTTDAQQALKNQLGLSASPEPTITFHKITEGPVVRRA
jgi:ribosomal protein L37AE/L43A